MIIEVWKFLFRALTWAVNGKMRHRLMLFMALFLTATLPQVAAALGSPSQPAIPKKETAEKPAQPPLIPLGAGLFKIGQVQLDQNTRTIRFPAAVNMSEGIIEYVLVSSSGKLHESIFKTDAEPYHIHLAALFLGLQPSPSTPAPAPPANPVIVWVEWKEGEVTKKYRSEDLVFNTETKGPMAHADWSYIGSRVINGIFLAQRDGSILATIADPDALIENPGIGRDNDDIWRVNAERVPETGTPVEIAFHIRNPQKESK